MPLVTLTIREDKSSAFKSAGLGAVHSALIAAGVTETDRFQRILELSSDDFRFDPEYPDLTARRTDDFILVVRLNKQRWVLHPQHLSRRKKP
jgi:hypothetical protein